MATAGSLEPTTLDRISQISGRAIRMRLPWIPLTIVGSSWSARCLPRC